MYKIIVNDFVEKKQLEYGQGLRLLDAKDLCLEMTIDYVCKLEGIRYLNKQIFYKKTSLQKGYCITDNSCDLYCKYTVYHKDPNGIIYSGKVKKIISFMTFRHKPIKQNYEVIDRPFEFTLKYKDVIDCIASMPKVETEQPKE